MSEENALVPVLARKLWEEDALVLSGIPNSEVTEKVRSELIREAAKVGKVMGDRLALVQGELLYEISRKNYWSEWGFKTFDEYIEKELEFKRRKAFYLIIIYEKFVIELGLPLKELRNIEWSKAKELLKVITKENYKSLFAECKKKSVVEIHDMVLKMRGKSTAIVSESFIPVHFSLTKEQSDNVEHALKIASEMAGSEKRGNLLDLIATDFLAGKVGEIDADSLLMTLDMHIKNIERSYGVTLEITKGKE